MTLQQLKYAIAVADSGSMNQAAARLFITQPSLSATIKELEEEIGVLLFLRSNRGITVTAEGEEFLGYARQVVDQYSLLTEKYTLGQRKEKFSVSMQHYSFAVKAFVELVKRVGMEAYEFAIHETKTFEVIQNVKHFRSELGVLYLSDFNEAVMMKILRENGLSFTPLFTCGTYVYLWREHPLASQSVITMAELEPYPCLVFEQGQQNSFYLAEEMKSTTDHARTIKADDRATMLNLMVGLNGYTLCSGFVSEELNGDTCIAVPLAESEEMRIGIISHPGAPISRLGKLFIEELQQYAATWL
ncbi:MAG: LysR family transcriptional regulator [Eubacterium aggregans]|uniref:DNA-binding transcriptional regulator, LysR family n=1 Tax=Eubacterium aggregans TaxID=81409 RepID=A0A1H3WZP5_9FIRM|nr:LysR family transcriptional regulator [Eubacterium aggregans]MEA5074562.1 LysR family transcriptional regulator [Eubacterium aggregans]SDZ92181.1 DNA-binding transcriptional regulator, LysR family [Eubacterium aggregans]